MRTPIAFCLILLSKITVFGQNKAESRQNPSQYSISWQQPGAVTISDSDTRHFLNFTGAGFAFEDAFLPRFSTKVDLPAGAEQFSATLVNPHYEPLSEAEALLVKDPARISNAIQLSSNVSTAKKIRYGVVSFIPIRINPETRKYEKLVSFDLSVSAGPAMRSGTRTVHTYAANSVLQNGTWYKLGMNASGMYKLSYTFLASLGINVSSIDPRNIRIYGNGGGMLPELASVSRKDDLVENAIFVQGEGDGVFDPADYVLFYAQGPNTWSYNAT